MSSCGSTSADAASRLGDRRSSTTRPLSAASAPGKPPRPVADADHADMGVAPPCRPHPDRRTPPTPAIAKSPRRRANSWKPKRRACRPGRQPHFGDDLVGLERGGQRAEEEIRRLDDARAGLADHRISASQVTAMPGISAAGSACAHAAADRAAVADLVVRDMRDRGLEQRMRGREPLVVLDVAPAHQRAEPHAVARRS